jgi:hypothetical protein
MRRWAESIDYLTREVTTLEYAEYSPVVVL